MFEIILFVLVCLSGLVMLVCRYFAPHLAERTPEPWYLDYARSFFPVLLLVFLLRGFVAEPFRIPSGSMYPTLEVGDFILVNKYAYGLRLPILQTKILDLGEPKRGDIVVFKYPADPSQNYIKRLVGLPGDVVEYVDKTIYVNGQKVEQTPIEEYRYMDRNGRRHSAIRYEQIVPKSNEESDGAVKYSTLISPGGMSRMRPIKVPDGHYFMMGDNRDNSLDSRAWGFLPDENIVGKAFFVWMSWGNEENENGGGFDFDRIGADIQAEEVATGTE